VPPGEPRRPDGCDVDAATAIVDQALQVRPEGTMLPLRAAEGLLRAYGVSVSAGRSVTSEDAAVAAANEELGYPVALKANGIVRRGRSERAGVALDLHDAAEVRRAWRGITDELGAPAMVEAVVQAMAPPGAELRVAVEPHPLLGPCSPSASVACWPTPSTIGSPAWFPSAPVTPQPSSRRRALVARWTAILG
jgi:acyl-CoA synthetase (NDP forming)